MYTMLKHTYKQESSSYSLRAESKKAVCRHAIR